MQVAFFILFLGLLHHSQSAPSNCQQRLQPFDQISPQGLEGRWIIVAAGGFNDTAELERFKMRDSGVMNWTAINSANMHFVRNDGFSGSCQSTASVITLEDSGFKFRKDKITVAFMHTTCPDCLVIHFDTQDLRPWLVLLLSKRREVEGAEMEEFKAHVGCLEMPYVQVMDPTKELCDMGLKGNGTTTQEDVVKGGQTA